MLQSFSIMVLRALSAKLSHSYDKAIVVTPKGTVVLKKSLHSSLANAGAPVPVRKLEATTIIQEIRVCEEKVQQTMQSIRVKWDLHVK